MSRFYVCQFSIRIPERNQGLYGFLSDLDFIFVQIFIETIKLSLEATNRVILISPRQPGIRLNKRSRERLSHAAWVS